jgi:RNA-directed DNA polymerase
VFLNDVDVMLERAQEATKQEAYEVVRYTGFADDLVVLVSGHHSAAHWLPKVEQRLRDVFAELDLTINEEKSRIVDFAAGEPFDFLGYTFRWVDQRKNRGKKMVLCRPRKQKRTAILRALAVKLRRHLHVPVTKVVQVIVNPLVRGWVQYFRWGNPGRDLSFVKWQVEQKVRRFASRQRPKRRGGRTWTSWSTKEIYGEWRLFSDYRVLPYSEPKCEAP